MIIFAKNAENLPDGGAIVESTAYIKEIPVDMIKSGFTTLTVLDSIYLNYYLKLMTEFVDSLLRLGIPKLDSFNGVVTANHQAGDLVLDENSHVKVYRDSGGFEFLSEKATTTRNGIIESTAVYSNESPIENVPYATTTVAGKIKKTNIVSKDSINKTEFYKILSDSNSIGKSGVEIYKTNPGEVKTIDINRKSDVTAIKIKSPVGSTLTGRGFKFKTKTNTTIELYNNNFFS